MAKSDLYPRVLELKSTTSNKEAAELVQSDCWVILFAAFKEDGTIEWCLGRI